MARLKNEITPSEKSKKDHAKNKEKTPGKKKKKKKKNATRKTPFITLIFVISLDVFSLFRVAFFSYFDFFA